MLEFLIDNIFVDFGGHIFHQMIGIPVGTNCAALFLSNRLFTQMYKQNKKRLKLLILHSIY